MKQSSLLPRFADHQAHAELAWNAALAAARPAAIQNRLWTRLLPLSLRKDRLKVLAIGKASIEMVGALRQRLGSPRRGVQIEGLAICVPKRLTRAAQSELASCNMRALPADHPPPTPRNIKAARAVAAFLESCEPDDTLLVLLSGGGSAHLAWPVEGLSLDELKSLSSDLMKSGATIHELNCVRKHLERLKGGRAAALCRAKRIRVGVLSDVIGDPLDVISSGPFAPDPTTYADALKILRKYKLATRHKVAVQILTSGSRGELAETPKPRDRAVARVHHTILLNNKSAVVGVANALDGLGFNPSSATLDMEGEASQVASRWIREELKSLRPGPQLCILGGETTVSVKKATGLGGPSQEFALAGAKALATHTPRGRRAALLTFSTDGVDGPTAAAGALVTDQTWAEIRKAGIDPARALSNHDSHTALNAVNALIRTGPTGTNVNHIAALMVFDE